MGNNSTKSLIRHFLTGLGSVLLVFGLANFAGAIDFVATELDTVWASGASIVGFVTTLVGFFRNKERLEDGPVDTAK